MRPAQRLVLCGCPRPPRVPTGQAGEPVGEGCIVGHLDHRSEHAVALVLRLRWEVEVEDDLKDLIGHIERDARGARDIPAV